MQYQDMTKKEMQREYHRLCQRYNEYEQQGLQLDLSRGKPAPEQLALSQRMLGELNSRSVLDSEDGTDCRNYGGLDGIPEAKALLAGMIGARPEQVMVGGNSSLTMMFDILSHAMLDGLLGAEPWVQVKDRKFLCPVPGYDRHFAMTEHFGFQLIPIPMHNDGPDMDMIEDLVQRDASIKGIWCVPKYLLRPKFEQVISIFREELDGSGIASWTEPRGGYFLSFDTMPGCAARTVELCRRAGVKFTPAGSTWPYGRDPQDSNIRIAPSFASAEEIEPAARLFTICVRLATLEKLAATRFASETALGAERIA